MGVSLPATVKIASGFFKSQGDPKSLNTLAMGIVARDLAGVLPSRHRRGRKLTDILPSFTALSESFRRIHRQPLSEVTSTLPSNMGLVRAGYHRFRCSPSVRRYEQSRRNAGPLTKAACRWALANTCSCWTGPLDRSARENGGRRQRNWPRCLSDCRFQRSCGWNVSRISTSGSAPVSAAPNQWPPTPKQKAKIEPSASTPHAKSSRDVRNHSRTSATRNQIRESVRTEGDR